MLLILAFDPKKIVVSIMEHFSVYLTVLALNCKIYLDGILYFHPNMQMKNPTLFSHTRYYNGPLQIIIKK